MNIRQVEQKFNEIETKLIQTRRDIHNNPEMGFEEFRTSKIISDWLKTYNVDVKEGIAGTGVVGLIEGIRPGPTIGIRVDMDAVLVEDKKNLPYSSNIPGLAHACGHDVHTVIGLGLGKILSDYKNDIKGNVKLIFQASEELPKRNQNESFDIFTEPPVGKRGASLAIEEGVLENPKVDALVGIHCWPSLRFDEVGYQYGSTMAGTGNFHIAILGKGGHAATPHKTVDSISIAAQVINALQTVVSRKTDPTYPLVLTIGTIRGGTRRSVIADKVDITGTVRALDPNLLENIIPRIMDNLIKSVTKGNGAEYIFNYGVDQPPVVNDDFMVKLAEESLTKLFGERAIELNDAPMTGEDFSFMSKQVPSVYLKLGISDGSKETSYPLHNAKFNVNESCIKTGILALTQIIMDFLKVGEENE